MSLCMHTILFGRVRKVCKQHSIEPRELVLTNGGLCCLYWLFAVLIVSRINYESFRDGFSGFELLLSRSSGGFWLFPLTLYTPCYDCERSQRIWENPTKEQSNFQDSQTTPEINPIINLPKLHELVPLKLFSLPIAGLVTPNFVPFTTII